MKTHSTNYANTFIEVAEDCPAIKGEIPPLKGSKKTVANLQFEILHKHPYKYTSDEVLFNVFALRKKFNNHELDHRRQLYFSKGQPCFRASPLTKRYGWGIHSNPESKIAIYGIETKAYNDLIKEAAIKKVKAMRSKKEN